ncbi:hypothetical protein GCM10010191_24570 [Actinomadura vinacea]|uniref:DUF397 domain-containing protein n=1 Tax=Actinomadura vinacea TaxID=115336 RepID=A0ABN3ITL2_9ACTN
MYDSFRSVAAVWRKSSHSQAHTQNCVELARVGGFVGVRDSKDLEGSPLVLSAAAARAFVAQVRAGRYAPPAG